MIQSAFLRRIVGVLLVILPEVYSFTEYITGLLMLTLILRWVGLADGTFARVTSIIWLIIAASRWTMRRLHVNNRKGTTPSSPLAVPVLVASELSRLPTSQQDVVPTDMERRELAIQRVIVKTGLSREEVEAQLRKYGL